MEIRAQAKSDVDAQRLAELAVIAMERSRRVPEGMSVETVLSRTLDDITADCHDPVIVAENDGELAGWLAFYKMSDLGIAQIWDWHPVVSPGEREDEISGALIREAVSHVSALGLHKISVDFRVSKRDEPALAKVLGWYAQAGITETIEEQLFRKELTEEALEATLPEEYTLGYISRTASDDLFACWEEVFSSGSDAFFNSLDADGRRKLFASSWAKEKPLIDGASLTLYHEDRLIGFCRLLPSHDSTDGFLAPIGILAAYRRKGLARKLLSISMLRLKELGYRTISFYVSTANMPAIAFYEKLGFVPDHRIVSLIGEVG